MIWTKGFLLALLFSMAPLFISAQQLPQYSQYIFNNFLLNPAISGIENYTDIKVGFRKQWTGIEQAPQTGFVAAHWKLGDDYLWKNPLSLPDKGDDPMSWNYMQNYTASPAHHGMGVIAVMDKAGPLSRLDAGLTYAYHLQLAEKYNLSVGVGAGLSRISLDGSSIKLENENDPAISNAITNQLKPALNAGVWFYGARIFAGFSVQQLLPQKLEFTNYTNENRGKEVPHIIFTTGYKLFIDDEISFLPSIMIKKVTATPILLDANVKVSFKDRFWLGGSYRQGDAYSALAGVNFNKMFNLTYAYDLTTSELNTVSNGSHEIVLGVQLNNVYKAFSKIRMW